MDQRSKLGYSSGSPFNQINANGITMQNTRRPLIAANRKGAQQLQPGKQYSGINGSTTEMPLEMLLELEPMLLERHLSSLSDKDKEVFTEKYGVLGADMKTAALTQMLAKYPDVAQAAQQQTMQSGGAVQTPLPSGNPSLWGNIGNPLQNFYGVSQESTLTRTAPVATPDTSQMYDTQVTQDRIDELTNRILADKTPVVPGIMTENYDKPIKSTQRRTGLLRDDREKKNGGEVMKTGGLTKAKAAEMLHDGTVHGEPITDKQRRYFAAIAFSDKKKGKMQNGGTTGGWKYEAPPTEGFHLVGIESNRPQNNVANLPSQGVTPSGKGRTATSGSPRKLQDTPDPGDEANWAKQREINNARTAPQMPPVNIQSLAQELPTAPLPTTDSRQPRMYGTQRFSNTTAAIAQVTGDPVYRFDDFVQNNDRNWRDTGPQMPTPRSMGNPMIGESTRVVAAQAPEWAPNTQAWLSQETYPPRAETDNYVPISYDKSLQWVNVYDPLSKKILRRNLSSGKYAIGASPNPVESPWEGQGISKETIAYYKKLRGK